MGPGAAVTENKSVLRSGKRQAGDISGWGGRKNGGREVVGGSGSSGHGPCMFLFSPQTYRTKSDDICPRSHVGSPRAYWQVSINCYTSLL